MSVMKRSELFASKVKQNPTNLLYHFSLGQALFEEERYEEAIEPFRACIMGRSDWMVARILLGRSLIALERNEEAVRELREARRLAEEQNHLDPMEEIDGLLETLDLV